MIFILLVRSEDETDDEEEEQQPPLIYDLDPTDKPTKDAMLTQQWFERVSYSNEK